MQIFQAVFKMAATLCACTHDESLAIALFFLTKTSPQSARQVKVSQTKSYQ